MDRGGHHSDAHALHSSALREACQTGDLAAQADSFRHLGAGAWWRSRYYEAEDDFHRALELYRAIGDSLGEAKALDNLGLVLSSRGYRQEAITYRTQALHLSASRRCAALDNPGRALRALGALQEASAAHEQALATFCELDNRYGEARALNNMGETAASAGGNSQILHSRALAVATQIGSRIDQARAHHGIGQSLHAADQPDQARDHLRRAHAIYRTGRSGHRPAQCGAL